MTAISIRSVRSSRRASKGFTLVEILIVVIILGILAAIVIPQFSNASTSAKKSNMASQDQTIKSQISLYMLQHNDNPPGNAAQNNGTGPGVLFTQLTGTTDVTGAATTGVGFGPYLQATPINPLTNSSSVVQNAGLGTASPGGTADGWDYNPATGEFHGVNIAGVVSDDGN